MKSSRKHNVQNQWFVARDSWGIQEYEARNSLDPRPGLGPAGAGRYTPGVTLVNRLEITNVIEYADVALAWLRWRPGARSRSEFSRGASARASPIGRRSPGNLHRRSLALTNHLPRSPTHAFRAEENSRNQLASMGLAMKYPWRLRRADAVSPCSFGLIERRVAPVRSAR